MSGPKPKQQQSRSPKGKAVEEVAKPVAEQEQEQYAGVNPSYVVFDEFGDVDPDIFNEGEEDDEHGEG